MNAPTSGAGVEIQDTAGAGRIQAYDRTGAAYKPLTVSGSSLLLDVSGVTIGTGSSTGMNFTGLQLNGANVGYLGAPINAQSGNYTFALTDAGKRIYSTNVGAQTITIPLNATIAMPVDDGIVTVINNGSTAISIAIAGGVTLVWAGANLTGARTLAPSGMCVIQKVATDTWVISGAGIS